MTSKETIISLLEINADARAAIARSYRIERWLDAGRLGSLRILYGTLDDAGVGSFLYEKDINTDLLRADIERQPEIYIPYSDKIVVPPTISAYSISDHLTSSGMRAWSLANAAAQAGQMGEVGVESLVLGVVWANSSETSSLFRKHGINMARLCGDN